MKKLLTITLCTLSGLIFADNTAGGLEIEQIDNAGVAGVKTVNDSNMPIKMIPYGIDANDMKTIKAHSRKNKENLKHQTYCNNMGGIDITDNSDVQISSGAIDAIFCKIIDDEKFNKYAQSMQWKHSKVVNGKVLETHVDDPMPTGEWRAFAPWGTVSGQYYATSVGLFSELSGTGYLDVSVPSDRCSASNQRRVDGSARFTVTTLCGNWSGGQQPSYANACFNGSCVQDRGWITKN